jgi:hypothetical protein
MTQKKYAQEGIEPMHVSKLLALNTLGYQFDPSIRWNIVVSRFHLIDRF